MNVSRSPSDAIAPRASCLLTLPPEHCGSQPIRNPLASNFPLSLHRWRQNCWYRMPKQHHCGGPARRCQDEDPEQAVRLPRERSNRRAEAPGHGGTRRLFQGPGESALRREKGRVGAHACVFTPLCLLLCLQDVSQILKGKRYGETEAREKRMWVCCSGSDNSYLVSCRMAESPNRPLKRPLDARSNGQSTRLHVSLTTEQRSSLLSFLLFPRPSSHLSESLSLVTSSRPPPVKT